jgi:hypothetical protein
MQCQDIRDGTGDDDEPGEDGDDDDDDDDEETGGEQSSCLPNAAVQFFVEPIQIIHTEREGGPETMSDDEEYACRYDERVHY